MGDAVTRLQRATEYALLSTVSGSAERKGALYGRLAASLTTQGAVNDADSIVSLPNFEAFQQVLPILTEIDGRKSIHPIWDDANLVSPAIAALALYFHATVHPKGASMFALEVAPDTAALYGYRLASFTVIPPSAASDVSHAQWHQASVFICGAALAFFQEVSLMRFAPFFLHAAVTGSIPKDALGVSNIADRVLIRPSQV